MCLVDRRAPSRCPPFTKSGDGVYEESGVLLTKCQPCPSIDPSPHSIHPFQLFGRQSRLKTWLKQAEPSWFLPDHPNGVGPSHHPSQHCPHHEDDFCLLQCLILTFLAQDMLSQRLKMAIMVTVATRYDMGSYVPIAYVPPNVHVTLKVQFISSDNYSEEKQGYGGFCGCWPWQCH